MAGSLLACLLTCLVKRYRADVVVAHTAGRHSIDPHDQPAEWIGARDARIGLHPVGGMQWALLCRQEREGRLEGVDAEMFVRWDGELASLELERIPDSHIAGALARNALDHNTQVPKDKLIGSERLFPIHRGLHSVRE